MKWSTTVSFALAAGGVLALAALVTHERSQTAAQFLQSIEKRFAAGDLDRDQLLRELALAQAQAEHEGQRELASRVQLERGRVLLELGSFADARTALAAVAAEGGARRELELLRIDLERRAGDAQAGLLLARAWLQGHTDDARAWDLSGQLQRMQSAAPRDEALRACARELVSEVARRAQACVRELAARPGSDPRRVALARDLRAFYGTRLESDAERVLVLCDRAATQAAAAREAFGRSLELDFDAGTLAALAEMLEEAGLGEAALDLVTAASQRHELAENERATAFLLHALVQRERWRYATLVSDAWLQRHPGNQGFLLDACRVSYSTLDLPGAQPLQLYNRAVALLGVSTAEIGTLPWYYIGEAHFKMGARELLENARFELDKYTFSEGAEPFPGARALAFRHIAECCRTLGLAAEERAALEAAVELDPRGSGETWLRLAELQLAAPRGGFRAPDLRWARGMALLPGRAAELLPRWLEIGAQELRAIGLDPRSVQQDIQNGLNVRPSSGAAPYELYTLARAQLEAGKIYEAQTLLQDLEQAVPGFVPAIDLRIDLALARGRTRDLGEAFLERLEKTGYDERSRKLRAALPAGVLSPADLRRVVHADPETSGRLAVARSFAARGERGSALRCLLELPAGRLGPEELLFAARLELESGAADSAFERLGALGEGLDRIPGALETWVDAGLRAGQADAVRAGLPARITALALDRPRFLALADRLLAAGEASLARGLLQRLDQGGKAFRGGDVLWRLAACTQALGQTDAFERLIERAAAFDTHGEVELLELLALPPAADPDALHAAVQAVRKAGWKASPLGQAALARLSGEPALLGPALEALRSASAGDPLIAILEDPGTNPAQTRAAAELVLALERPALAAWLRVRLEALSETLDPTWPHWIRALLARRAGERESEERELRALLLRERQFAPAWDRLVELHTRPADEGECDLDLRLERATALGEAAGTPAERDWDRSRALERAGQLEDALAAARSAATAAPESGPILRHFARLALRMERLPVALVAYRRALPRLAAPSGARSTAEYLELLESARAAEPPLLDAQAERAELETLAARAPDDPRVLLAQAQNDLETSVTDAAFGAERAAGRLEQFRSQHARRSFEELAAGSTRSWTRFLLELDPARARAFLEAELELDPGNLEAWALLPRCSAADGRDADALAEVAFVQRLAPGAEGLSEYLRVRGRGDWTPEGIALVAERLRRIDPALGSSTAELANELRTYLNLGPRGVPKALQIGAALTPAQLAAQPVALRAEVFWMQAIALLARGEGDDLAQARMRATVLGTLLRDPARRPLVAALRGLARPAP